MNLYTVADPHGFLDEMKAALNEQGFFNDPEGKLVVCGDVLDRGAQAVEMVDFLIDLLEKDRLVFIKGNHEDLFFKCMQDVAKGELYELAYGVSYHNHNGTWDTLLQLTGMDERMAFRFPEELVRRVMETPFYTKLLPAAVDYYEPEGSSLIFVHGWIPVDTSGVRAYQQYAYNPDWREASYKDWYAARWLNGMEMACKKHILEPGKTIVCGHFHTSWGHSRIEKKGSEWARDADFSPFEAEGIIALDACTVHSHKVNCRVFRI